MLTGATATIPTVRGISPGRVAIGKRTVRLERWIDGAYVRSRRFSNASCENHDAWFVHSARVCIQRIASAFRAMNTA